MLFEKNRKTFSVKQTNIRYFFMTDRIGMGELSVERCPAKKITGEFFTKVTHGCLFKNFLKHIINLEHEPSAYIPKGSHE